MAEKRRGLGRVFEVAGLVRAALDWVPSAAQPTLLALLLALISWPIVAATWDFGYRDQNFLRQPVDASLAWTGSAGGVFLSAIIAGPLGGLVVRRNRQIGAGLTFWLAFFVAIIGAQLVPALVGQTATCYTNGEACDRAGMTSQVIIDDVQSFPLLMLFGPLVEPVAILLLAAGVVFWAAVLGPRKTSRSTVRPKAGDRFAW